MPININFGDLEKNLRYVSEQKETLFVGWLDTQMSKIAKIHEYGAIITVTDKMRGFLAAAYNIHLKASTTQIVIPPRPHRYETIQKNKDKWREYLMKLLVKNKFDIAKSLAALGKIVQQDYKSTIKAGNFKELTAATIHIRGVDGIVGTTPLNATGEFERTIQSELIND